MKREGHCACGQVRFELSSEPLFVHCCHCTRCQCETGSAFVINALIETANVKVVSGTTEEVVVPTASGKGQRIVRCDECHVALWSHYAYGAIADLIAFVRVGTLTSAGEVVPDIHIFASSKLPWVVIPEGATVVSEFYRASEHWPKESLDRRAALFAEVE